MERVEVPHSLRIRTSRCRVELLVGVRFDNLREKDCGEFCQYEFASVDLCPYEMKVVYAEENVVEPNLDEAKSPWVRESPPPSSLRENFREIC